MIENSQGRLDVDCDEAVAFVGFGQRVDQIASKKGVVAFILWIGDAHPVLLQQINDKASGSCRADIFC